MGPVKKSLAWTVVWSWKPTTVWFVGVVVTAAAVVVVVAEVISALGATEVSISLASPGGKCADGNGDGMVEFRGCSPHDAVVTFTFIVLSAAQPTQKRRGEVGVVRKKSLVLVKPCYPVA